MASIAVNKNEQVAGFDVLGIEDCKKALEYSIAADQPVNLIGPPGVGKSAIVRDIAEKIGLPLHTIILALCDPTDIGGALVTGDHQVDRLPLGIIKIACTKPVVLFLDELTCAPASVQAAALRLTYERVAGDLTLHPGTRIIAASNPPDQAAGGSELSLPLLGRMTQIQMRPHLKEVQEYFFNLGAPDSTLRMLAVDFAATLGMAPDLLQIDPPAGTSMSGKAYGSPRSWERALKVCATALDRGEQDTSTVFAACLSGNVGDDSAAAYMTIRKVRHDLPSCDEMKEDPMAAKLPNDVNSAIAVLGVIAQVCQTDPCPGNIYADRLQNEVRMAATSMLGRYAVKKHVNSPHYKEGLAAQGRLLRTLGATISKL